ncbi:hypothetical protein [Nodularia spumigena]|uniref:hypothetical protein n=1 Tax=Nodularia spumigena TaxID=70799 RepID=UPI002B218293|nr:hypothetical protein [Nodularia spumigena]MEA5557701.1 hypothetical protein [Nodularia spumigena CH309]
MLLLDSVTGGQSVIDTSGLNPPPGGLRDLTGTALDAPFAPDRLFFINTFGGNIYVDFATLTAGATASKTYLGRGSVGSGEGTLIDGQGSQGVLVAMDNSNTSGVTGTSIENASGATTGFELFVPNSVLGIGSASCGRVLALATIVTGNDGTWGNQTLPGLPGDWSASILGRAPNLTTINGQQYLSIPLGPTADINADGIVDVLDLLDFLDAFGVCAGEPTPCGEVDIDLNADGSIDVLDFLDFLSVFSTGC